MGAGVGSFGEQGPVAAFGSAVGPQTAKFDESVFELPSRAPPAPVGAAPVDPRVVGKQPSYARPVTAKPDRCPVQERCAGRVFLVGVHLAVGQAGAVIAGGVNIVVTELELLVPVVH